MLKEIPDDEIYNNEADKIANDLSAFETIEEKITYLIHNLAWLKTIMQIMINKEKGESHD